LFCGSSWKLPVLLGFCNNQDWQFFGSGFFQRTATSGCLILKSLLNLNWQFFTISNNHITLVTTSNIDRWRFVPMLLHVLWKSSHYPFCKSLLAREGLYLDKFESCTNNTPLYKVIHKVLETGDKYQGWGHRSKVGIKKYRGKNCVWKEIGEKIKSGDEKCTEEKIVYKIHFLLKLFVKVIPSFCFTFPSCIPWDCFLYSSWNQILWSGTLFH